MASISRTTLRRRLGILIAGAVVVTSLTTATAAAVAPPPPTPAPQATRPDPNAASTAPIGAFGSVLSPTAPTGPRSQFPMFVLDRGRFTRFDPPGPVEGSHQDNAARINNRGQIGGSYIQEFVQQGSGPPLPRFRGFLRDRGGRITRIDAPGAAGTISYDLNDAGTVVGIYSTTSPSPASAGDTRGFLRDARGRYTTIQVPSAVQVQARGINNRGQVVGEYRDANGSYHGFRWDRGRVVTLDRGPADSVLCCSGFDHNDRGQIVGVYVTTAGAIKGFVLDRDRATTIAAPGVAMTVPVGINNRGRIVGVAVAADQQTRGFLLRDGANGRFTPIDVPGAPVTKATGINDAGSIIGLYRNPDAAPGPQPAVTSPMGRMS
jgi:probable HAF family extracellular repeat protein